MEKLTHAVCAKGFQSLWFGAFLLFSINISWLESATISGKETDRLALLVFKDSISSDPLRALVSWNHTLHFCDWLGITCNIRHRRVQVLNLQSKGLVGSLPPNIANLTFLEEINLQNNSFYGHLPQELGRLSRLQRLNLGNNSFGGGIPANLSSCSDLRVITLIDNIFVGRIPAECSSLSKLIRLHLPANNLTGIIPPSFGNLSSLTHLSLARNSLEGSIPEELGRITSLKFLQISQNELSELLKATNGFSSENLIGEGSYGSVYKGILGDAKATTVAVKVLNLAHRGASKSFVAECEVLRNVRHRNIVKILTSCSSLDFKGNDFKALVFEFMSNGSLESWLHQKEDGPHQWRKLTLIQRLNVAIDVASALDYFHQGCQMPVIHGDLKPSNVLLDDDMNAHVSDFGLARFLHQTFDNSSSIGIKGSVGYVAPEFGLGSQPSILGDVYSYGILLLEMFMGKRPTDEMFKDGLNLHKLARMSLPERVMEIIDPLLLSQEEEEINGDTSYNNMTSGIKCLALIISIGVTCSTEMPRERMEMKDVVVEMHAIRDLILAGPSH